MAAVVVAPAGLTADEAGAAERSVRFAVKGDWGWGGAAQAAVTRRMCREHTRIPFAFVLTTGDNFSWPRGRATADNWVRPEACLRRAGLRFHAAWGNHDVVASDTATVLGSRRRWYRVRRGPVEIIVLDGNRPRHSAQLRFLRRALRSAPRALRVVATHQPVYSSGVHAGGEAQQRFWAPLFRRGGVRLVLQGHNHTYERVERDGITYLTTGGGGAPLTPCVRLETGLRRCLPTHHFLAVSVGPGGASVRAVGTDGSTLERVRIRPRAASG